MGLLRGVARTAAVAGTATAVSNRVSRRQARRWSAQDEANQAYEAPEPNYAQPEDSMTSQLQELARLKQQGVITQTEFEAKKRQVLGI